MESTAMLINETEPQMSELLSFDLQEVIAHDKETFDNFVFVTPERIEKVDTDTLNMASPFKDLFPIGKRLLGRIKASMKTDGFDGAHPIVLWKGHNMTVVDGHARLIAARENNIPEIPVVMKEFKDEDDALEYAIAAQRNRRNSSDVMILKCIENLGKAKADIIKQKLANKGIVLDAPHSEEWSQNAAELIGVMQARLDSLQAGNEPVATE